MGIILAAFGVLAVVLWGGYFFFKEEQEAAPILSTEADVVQQERPRGTRSFTVFDNNFAYFGGSLYYRSGTDDAGEPLYTILPVAEPDSFQKIASVVAPPRTPGSSFIGSGSVYAQSSYMTAQNSTQSQSQTENGSQQLGSAQSSGQSSYTVSYYTDGENVYVVVSSGNSASTPQIIPGADPDSFHVLNSEYAADENNVYVVVVTCVGDSCSASVNIVDGADPDTFQPFPNQQQVMNADCTGYVIADAQDQNYLYNDGQVVDGVSVYLIGSGGDCDNTPVLISP